MIRKVFYMHIRLAMKDQGFNRGARPGKNPAEERLMAIPTRAHIIKHEEPS